MPTYSYGEESPLKFQISDKLAKHYNEAAAEFFKAQRRFLQKYGRQWDPATEPIKIHWSKKQRKAWNDVAHLFNVATKGYEHEAGPFHPNDFMDDFLVKNAGSEVAKRIIDWELTVGAAAMAGALYVLLRGL